MKIVNKEDLKNEPKGTLYIPYAPTMLFGCPSIKTSDSKEFHGEMSLLPWIVKDRTYGDVYTQWMTTDTSECDLDYKQYAVFSKAEVTHLIHLLTWSLSECSFTDDIEQDWWFADSGYRVTNQEVEDATKG